MIAATGTRLHVRTDARRARRHGAAHDRSRARAGLPAPRRRRHGRPPRQLAPTQQTAAARRSRLAERGVDRTLLLVVPGGAVHAAAVHLPVPLRAQPVASQPHEGGDWLANYRKFFTDRLLWRDTIWTTLKLALPATMLNVLASRCRSRSGCAAAFRGQRWLTTILVVPITLGTVLIAEGMLTYLGPSGWFTAVPAVRAPLRRPDPPHAQLLGRAVLAVISGFPFAFLLILSYLTGIDPALARAAATLGAGPRQQFRHIYPAAAGARARHVVLPVLRAGVLGVPVGGAASATPAGPTRVISIAAYEAAFEQYDYSMASAIAMIMGFVQLVVVARGAGRCAVALYTRPGHGRRRRDEPPALAAGGAPAPLACSARWLDRAWRGLLSA